MGFLFSSKSLAWEDSLEFLKYVRDHGIEQFLHTFHAVRSVQGDLLRWGDEIEYGVLHLEGSPDDSGRCVKASLRSSDIIEDLKRIEEHGQMHGLCESDKFMWMPEYGSWMLESTPGKPYDGLSSLLSVEKNMMMRRSRLLSVLRKNEVVPTLSCFPMLGVGDSTYPSFKPNGPVANSLFVPDEVIFPHPRFPTLTQNIRKRRGEKVVIARPKFMDTNTRVVPQNGNADHVSPSTSQEADNLPYVYADAMAFGMGCCSLQTTFQAKDLAESRHLYDQLAPLTPIMLALSAATPILRGWLTDTDSRWGIVSQSVDDRTRAERGVAHQDESRPDHRLAGDGITRLSKSRFSPIDCYMCNCKNGANELSRASIYNDVPLTYDQDHYKRLITSGVDPVLAQHVAHLFARDPLVIFPERVELDDRIDSDHWESIQSTNWQTVRWKPPPGHKGVIDPSSGRHIGWRVEFRSMEIQLTDFENAAFVVFVVLLSRVILGLELNTYIPISKLDENMEKAEKRDAVLGEKFWFRSDLMPEEIVKQSACGNDRKNQQKVSGIELMSIDEILNGKDDYYPGLIPLCRTYLDFIGCDSILRCQIDKYLDFLSDRGSGRLQTNAAWIREFVCNHRDYKQDSRVPQSTAYDLIVACKEIGEGLRHEPSLIGESNRIPRISPGMNPFQYSEGNQTPTVHRHELSAAKTACAGSRKCKQSLLRTYIKRAIGKKVDSANKDLNAKLVEMEHLKSEIDDLMDSIALMRAGSDQAMTTTS